MYACVVSVITTNNKTQIAIHQDNRILELYLRTETTQCTLRVSWPTSNHIHSTSNIPDVVRSLTHENAQIHRYVGYT